MNKDQEQHQAGDKKPDRIKKTAASVPPDCPLCSGQTEWMRAGEIYVCHFCGAKGRATQ
jgi:hypothetical protein